MLIKVDGFSYKVLCSFFAHKSKQSGAARWRVSQLAKIRERQQDRNNNKKILPDLHHNAANSFLSMATNFLRWAASMKVGAFRFFTGTISLQITRKEFWNISAFLEPTHSQASKPFHLCSSSMSNSSPSWPNSGWSMAPCLGKVTYMPGNQCLLSD